MDFSLGATTTIPVPQKAKCPTSDWILFGEHCYLVTTSQANQTQAQMDCQAHAGADLASVHKEEENLLIAAYVEAYGNAWIGLMKDEKGLQMLTLVWAILHCTITPVAPKVNILDTEKETILILTLNKMFLPVWV